MTEILHAIAGILGSIDLGSLMEFVPIPFAGVGGGVEARESVDILSVVIYSAVFVLGLAAIFGFGLAFAAQKFSVKMDPRIEEVKEELAGAHCGACGYAGCQQYAEAVVQNPEVATTLCTPGGARTAEAVARITGKAAGSVEPIVSRIMCQGGTSLSLRRFKYEGVLDCRAAVLAGGGDKSCIYGCLGYGTCVRSCPFNAMKMGEDGLPIVNMAKCTGCRKCEQACPKKVIEVLPMAKAVIVACHSKDKGGDTRKVCKVGCIACGKCVKVCPFDAPSIIDNHAVIDLKKCQVCGLCVAECPTKSIIDFIPQRPKAFITDLCNGCQKCMRICPVDAASGEKKQKHVIDQSRCVGCGICVAACPRVAIEGAFNTQLVKEEAAKKKAAKEAKEAA